MFEILTYTDFFSVQKIKKTSTCNNCERSCRLFGGFFQPHVIHKNDVILTEAITQRVQKEFTVLVTSAAG